MANCDNLRPRKNASVLGKAAESRTILLVEDETSVRNLVTRFLTLNGFKVLAAESGHAALPLWAEHHEEIDLLLTDVVMPGGMSGRELAEKLQAERPTLKVLFTSGYNVELLNAEIAVRTVLENSKSYAETSSR
jgi:two-component system cell cycle sensor histidine kinase/response regulator CckA